MSEKEKAMLEKITALPDVLQDRFLDRLDGATMALDILGISYTDPCRTSCEQQEQQERGA